MLCDVAQVSRSGYYRWAAHTDEPKKDYRNYLLIKEIFDKGRSRLGWRTIQMRLRRDKNIVMNHKKIQRIKNHYGLYTKIRKVNPYKAIMKKTQEHRMFDNVLNRSFDQVIPYKVFGTDITYLPFNHRMAYLSAVKDFASGEIVAWAVSQHLTMDIVLDTVKYLKEHVSAGSLIHSDQGFHYTNPEYIRMIKELNMVQSMSRKGNCIDNAPTESFFGHFKDDSDYRQCRTFEELKETVRKDIQYYNHERPQWNLKKMTPVEYRNHLLTSPQ